MDGLLENTLALMKEAAGLTTIYTRDKSPEPPQPPPPPPIGVTSEGLAFEASDDQS